MIFYWGRPRPEFEAVGPAYLGSTRLGLQPQSVHALPDASPCWTSASWPKAYELLCLSRAILKPAKLGFSRNQPKASKCMGFSSFCTIGLLSTVFALLGSTIHLTQMLQQACSLPCSRLGCLAAVTPSPRACNFFCRAVCCSQPIRARLHHFFQPGDIFWHPPLPNHTQIFLGVFWLKPH